MGLGQATDDEDAERAKDVLARMLVATEGLIVGRGALKWRLLLAFEAVAPLRASDFPVSARAAFGDFHAIMTSSRALGGAAGTARSTVHLMKGPTASKAARAFVSAARLVHQERNCVVFVVSADGPVTAFTFLSEDERVAAIRRIDWML